MFRNEEYIQDLESIFENVKFTANSFVRLKILATLFVKPQNMKDITDETSLSYSSISSNMHELELRNFVYRENNKYYLTNSAKVRIKNILELNRIICLTNEFFNILDGHIVDMIPNESVVELYLLGQANLMESSGVDAYKTYNYIERCLNQAESVKCILPFCYDSFINILKKLISDDKEVEILISDLIVDIFEEKYELKDLNSFNESNSFLLIVTDKVMILGLFMENGYFDQNRLLTSRNPTSVAWANDLFENFKKENK